MRVMRTGCRTTTPSCDSPPSFDCPAAFDTFVRARSVRGRRRVADGRGAVMHPTLRGQGILHPSRTASSLRRKQLRAGVPLGYPAWRGLMTLADLRRAAELLPPGTGLTLSRESLLEALVAADVSATVATPDAEPERWMDAGEVAGLLNVTPRFCYDHCDQLGGKRLSRRCVRFSSVAVNRFMRRGRTHR